LNGAAPKVPSTAIEAETGALVLYDNARHALAEYHRINEVKAFRDKTIALQAYAKQAKNTDLIVQATEARMRAERRAGELLIEMAKRGERQKAGDADGRRPQPSVPKLADLGVSKTQSSRWQALANLDIPKFKARVQLASTAYNRIARSFIREEESGAQAPCASGRARLHGRRSRRADRERQAVPGHLCRSALAHGDVESDGPQVE
jgi:hypothetical protein